MPVHIHMSKAPAAATDPDTLHIGLLNNLSDAGLERGEHQVIDLLRRVAGPQAIRLMLVTLPEIQRGPAARARIDKMYTPFETMLASELDGLIVTGCEPQAAHLHDEPFWRSFAEVVDWAGRHTRSTIWSCLAAHAAVLHLDGIERRRLPAKASGLYKVTRVDPHPLFDGAGAPLCVPHSRYNDLAEDDLVKAGYRILTRSTEVGVDTFVREDRSLFVFLQGHPEYDVDALFREYRRDVLRYLDGSSAAYPAMPAHYLGREMEQALQTFARNAQPKQDPRLFAAFPARMGEARPWTTSCATSLFGNWLMQLRARTPEHVS